MASRFPICKRPTDPAAEVGTTRPLPFCSERCKLIDLGRWLSDAYQIPADPFEADDDEAPPAIWEDPDASKRRRRGG